MPNTMILFFSQINILVRSQGCVNLITAPSVTGQGAGGAVSSVAGKL